MSDSLRTMEETTSETTGATASEPTDRATAGDAAGTGRAATDALRQAMVEHLMAIIGAPDDEEVARAADGVVRDLDTRLREAARAAV